MVAVVADAPLISGSRAQVSHIAWFASLAMFLAAAQRCSFSVLALPIQAQLGLSLPQMGVLQSSMLLGYVIGQVPAGLLADSVGGARLLAVSLLAWSLCSIASGAAAATPAPYTALLASRAALGLAQSALLPAIAALAARWFIPGERSSRTSGVFAAYSVGTVVGLLATAPLAEAAGWPNALAAWGVAGAASGTAALRLLSLSEPPRLVSLQPPAPRAAVRPALLLLRPSELAPGTLRHLGTLCVAHGIIGWSFFVLQAWVPSMLAAAGLADLRAVGTLSALPWVATAVSAIVAGKVADYLQRVAHWSPSAVRTALHTASCLGGAAGLLPLAAGGAPLPPTAVAALLTLAVAAQGCNYAGFHAYVQDVAPSEAGLVLALTNTCGALAGVAGNLATGALAGAHGYGPVFGLTAALHAVSLVAWLAGAHGQRLVLRDAPAAAAG